tara:strand:+ start:15114 stop:16112 length:999 start_codon:yes stop_codon:yes gene_type:complete
MNHIVCMVKDGDKYLADFITYHLKCVDKIWFIDHNSENSIRRFESEKIRVFDFKFNAQFQGEAVTLLSRHIRKKYKSGFLFILDVDEFLPFKDLKEVNHFTDEFKNKKVIGFNWLNGFCFNQEKNDLFNLSEYDQIFFTSNINPNQKVALNLARITCDFAVGTGGHSISEKKYLFRKKITPYFCGLTLYHILASSKNDLFIKIERYINQMKYRLNVKGIGGWSVRKYIDNRNLDFLNLIAYYRSNFIDVFFNGKDQFRLFELDIFKYIRNTKDHNKYKKISRNFKKNKKLGIISEEDEYIAYKKNDNDIDKNIKWFLLNQNSIQIKKPKYHD